MSKEAKAEEFKAKANTAYASGQYQNAISLYTNAINLVPSAIYYSNRAACYMKLQLWQKALEDTTRSVQLDPGYIKGKARHVEALIKLGQGDDAVRYAQEVYNAESSTKHHNLLDDAQKCQALACSDNARFEDHLNAAAISLAREWIEMAANVSRKKTLTYSTEERHKDEAKEDEADLANCEITEAIYVIREHVTAMYNQLSSDYKFSTTVMLGFRSDPLLTVYYYLLLICLRDFCLVGIRVGMDPYPGQEMDDKGNAKPLPDYLGIAKKELTAIKAKQSTEYAIFTVALLLLSNASPEQVSAALNQAAQIDQNSGTNYGLSKLSAGYAQFLTKKEQGSNSFKNNQHKAAFDAFSAGLAGIVQLALLEADTIKGPLALLFLALRANAAIITSNLGMTLNKLGDNGSALSYLRAASLLDPTYYKAHVRAANIYKDQSMYLECIRECGIAVSINEADTKGCQELAKSCQSGAEKYARPDYYKMLGVGKSVDPSSQEYASAYKKACLKWHPDRHRDPVKKRFAQLKFRKLQEADEVLKNPQKRQIYEAGGNPAAGSAGGGMSMDMGSMAGMDVSQIFNMFSRMGGMGGRSGNVQFKVHCTTGGGGIGMDISQLFRGFM
ncbi:Putative DnaJ domain protein [Giardia duodenalis]|uniref:Putative DnaJ domain protein n=1 Tax=Giardia intestinalis TaxID=5741 RepID=V6TJW2_GIAIN|nr:Putative DnaJ domain protein [Giardia intestinalis]